MNSFVLFKTLNTRPEAEVLKSFLDSQGIASIISADDAGGAYPFPLQSTSKGVQVLVREEDVQRAKHAINDRD